MYFVPALFLSALCIVPPKEVGAIIGPTLERRKLRHSIVQSYIAIEHQFCDSNSGSLTQILCFYLLGFITVTQSSTMPALGL
jgi:hypothetical protein